MAAASVSATAENGTPSASALWRSISSATLLLALVVAAAADARLRLPPLEHWLRGDTA